MLQKELNLLQGQPRKQKEKSFQRSVRVMAPTMKLTSQKIQTECEEGVILGVSFPLPLAQQDFVKIHPNSVQIWHTVWTDWFSELTQSSFPLQS